MVALSESTTLPGRRARISLMNESKPDWRKAHNWVCRMVWGRGGAPFRPMFCHPFYWTVCNGIGCLPDAVAFHRDWAIKRFLTAYPEFKTWRHAYRQRFRLVKIRVTLHRSPR